MKSLLQTLGVVKKDEPAPQAPAVVNTPAPAKVPPIMQRQASILAASAQQMADAGNVAVEVSPDVARIAELRGTMEDFLMGEPKLKPLFTFLETSAKLTKVQDVKVRAESALAVSGLTAEEVLGSSQVFTETLTDLRSSMLSTCEQEFSGPIKEMGESKVRIEAEILAAEAKLNDLRIKLSETQESLTNSDAELTAEQKAIRAAEEELSSTFSVLFQQLQQHFQ